MKSGEAMAKRIVQASIEQLSLLKTIFLFRLLFSSLCVYLAVKIPALDSDLSPSHEVLSFLPL